MVLPGNRFFRIEIASESKAVEIVTLGINNQEIIFLPFSHEFPLQLNKGEYIFIVLNTAYQAFVEVEIKKCGESSLTIAYTTDYSEFLKEEFATEQEVDADQLTTSLHIKSKNRGAVYLKLKSSPDEVSVVTVKATLSFSKTKLEKAVAGGKGLITYRLTGSKNAELELHPLVCPIRDKVCHKDFVYSAISS